jgi:hypothetical protein
MGWSKVATGCALMTASVALLLSGCGGASDATGSPAASAGASTTGGAGAAASGSHAGGAAAGQSAGGAGAGGSAEGAGAAGQSAGGTGGGLGNVYVDALRGREGCLPRGLSVAGTASGGLEVGQVRCALTFFVVAAPGAACACDASQHLVRTSPAVDEAVRQKAKQGGFCGSGNSASCESLCLCDLQQSSGAALTQCQNDPTPIAQLPPGFCYVDVTLTPPLGNPALVSTCPVDSRRELRILGPVSDPAPAMFLACAGSSL